MSIDLKRELEKRFKQKFKIRKRQRNLYVTYSIEYTDGVSKTEIQKFVEKFKKGYVDNTEEIYVNCNKDGIADFIFVNRKMSDKARESVIQKLKEYWGEDILNLSCQEQLRRFGKYLDSLIIETFNNTSFPAAL